MPRARLAIPRRFSIKGRRWRVVTKKRVVVGGVKATGACSKLSRRIELEARMKRDEREATFIHEALHASWPSGIVSDATEETLICLLEEPLQDVIRAMVGRRNR